jgi:hypothetical protein
VATGCKSNAERQREREISTLKLHLETPADGSPFTMTAKVLRENPVLVSIAGTPFLDETSLERATVVATAGGHAIQLQYDRHGTLVLESVTSNSRGRRIAILATFPESRWLAAPKFSQRLTTGVLTFTPDASREESERIVRGLNRVAQKLKKQPKPEKPQRPSTPAKSTSLAK